MAVAGEKAMPVLFPENLSAYATRLTLYSITLAVLTITKTPNQRLIKPISGMGISIASTVAIIARLKNRDNEVMAQLETDAKLGLAADRITALETIEAERIREKLTVELKNSQTRLSEWE